MYGSEGRGVEYTTSVFWSRSDRGGAALRGNGQKCEKGRRIALSALFLCLCFLSPNALASPPTTVGPVVPEGASKDRAVDQPQSERSFVIAGLEIEGREEVSLEQIQEVLDHEGLKVGELLRWPEDHRVRRARDTLAATGYFSRVTLTIRPEDPEGRDGSRVVLVIELDERSSLTIRELNGASTRMTPFFGGIEVLERNFLGRSMHLGGGLIWGTLPRQLPKARRQQGYKLYTELPGIAGSRLGLVGIAFLLSASEPYRVAGATDNPDPGLFRSLNYNRMGGVLGVTLPFTSGLGLGIDYRLEAVDASLPETAIWSHPNGEARPIDLELRDGLHRLATSEFILSWDGRGHDENEGSGGRIRLDLQLSSPAIASHYEYLKVRLGGSYAFRLPWGIYSLPASWGDRSLEMRLVSSASTLATSQTGPWVEPSGCSIRRGAPSTSLVPGSTDTASHRSWGALISSTDCPSFATPRPPSCRGATSFFRRESMSYRVRRRRGRNGRGTV